MAQNRRSAFTVIELVMVVALVALVSGVAWQAYSTGIKNFMGAGENLSAIQSSMVLMENIAEDVRQISVLTAEKTSIVPFTMLFSTNGKSFMMRKSTLTDSAGSMAGSSFTVVIYQLVENPAVPGTYTVRRVERTTDGLPIAGTSSDQDEHIFRSLLLKDMQYDMLVQLIENEPPRSYVRVSLTAVNTASGMDSTQPRVYFISNIFEPPIPELINNKPGQVGFARRFCLSLKYILIGEELVAPPGYEKPLPPVEWPDQASYKPFRDFISANGTPKDVRPPGTINAFNGAAPAGLPTKRANFVSNAVKYLKKLVSDKYRGRVVGHISDRNTPSGQIPKWTVPISIDCASVTSSVAVQVDNQLTAVMPYGTEAIQTLGHLLGTYVTESGKGPFYITDAAALALKNGQ